MLVLRGIPPPGATTAAYDSRNVPAAIASNTPRGASRTLYTEVGVLIGTSEYMSPEHADLGVQDVDTRNKRFSTLGGERATDSARNRRVDVLRPAAGCRVRGDPEFEEIVARARGEQKRGE